jgi:Ethanolamine utilization protein EutJ (predicted chaperonin)
VAADLKNLNDTSVEVIKGGLGELSVSADGKVIYDSSRLWYPTPAGVIRKVRAALGEI